MDKNLTVENMKAYLKTIFDLESAIFLNDQMMEIYTQNRCQNPPIEPIFKLAEPTMPSTPALSITMTSSLWTRTWSQSWEDTKPITIS